MKLIFAICFSLLSLSAWASPVGSRPVDTLSNEQVTDSARLDKMDLSLQNLIQPAIAGSFYQARIDVIVRFSSVDAAQQAGADLSLKVKHVADNLFSFTPTVKELLYLSANSDAVRLYFNGPLRLPEQPSEWPR